MISPFQIGNSYGWGVLPTITDLLNKAYAGDQAAIQQLESKYPDIAKSEGLVSQQSQALNEQKKSYETLGYIPGAANDPFKNQNSPVSTPIQPQGTSGNAPIYDPNKFPSTPSSVVTNNQYATSQPTNTPYYTGATGSPTTIDPNNPVLPPNPTYEDIYNFEQAKQAKYAADQKAKIAEQRAKLLESLTKQGTDLFNINLPSLDENLNTQGVYGSATARERARADALSKIALSNNDALTQYDQSALSTGLQTDQNALDSALSLRRSQLETKLQEDQAAKDAALARELADRQRRNSLTEALINGGTQLGTGYLALKALAPKAASASIASSEPFVSNGLKYYPSSGFSGGSGSLISSIPTTGAGGLASLAAAGYGASQLSNAATKKYGDLAGVLANPIGYQLNKAKSFVSNPISTVKNVGNSIGKSISKAFCFDGMTAIEMSDGTVIPICELTLGDATKGGIVESVRISYADKGSRYSYKGIIVTGEHAVKEDGRWVRVKNSKNASPIDGDGEVYSIVTSKHRIYSENVEFADEHETDNYEHLTIDQSLDELNKQELAEVA